MVKPLDPERPRKYSSSLCAGLGVLDCFSSERPVRGIADMADELDLGRATTHRYARTLVTLGYLEQDDHDQDRPARRARADLNGGSSRESSSPVLCEADRGRWSIA